MPFAQAASALTAEQIRVDGRYLHVADKAYSFSELRSVSVASEKTYRSRTIPFGVAVAFTVWTIAEVINEPDQYYTAVFTAIMALLFFGVVRLMGGVQLHTVLLNTSHGQIPVLRSRDGRAVSDLVRALRQSMAEQGASTNAAWQPGRAAHG